MVSRSSQYQHLLWAANVHSPGCCAHSFESIAASLSPLIPGMFSPSAGSIFRPTLEYVNMNVENDTLTNNLKG